MHQFISLIIGLVLCGAPVPPPGQPAPLSALTIGLYEADPSPQPLIASVTLVCDPPGGTHPAAASACATLAAVGGDFRALRPINKSCPLIYQPVIVRVNGHWRGQPVTFEGRYENRCVAEDRSADVFRF